MPFHAKAIEQGHIFDVASNKEMYVNLCDVNMCRTVIKVQLFVKSVLGKRGTPWGIT